MSGFHRLLLFIGLGVCLISPASAQQSDPTIPAPVIQLAQPSYPDATSGLEHLAKDIMKAQKGNDVDRANLLLHSLVLPQPREWYQRVFGPTIANREGALYERATASVSAKLGQEFLAAAQLQPESMAARRFDRTCDDNAGEFTFGILHARLEPAPLYEIRFFTGSRLLRIFSLRLSRGHSGSSSRQS